MSVCLPCIVPNWGICIRLMFNYVVNNMLGQESGYSDVRLSKHALIFFIRCDF